MIAATLANKIPLIMCCEFIIVKCILKIKHCSFSFDNFCKSLTFLYSFEGGFSKFSSSEQAKGELLSPLMRFPTETVAKLYSRVTDQRLRIDVPG